MAAAVSDTSGSGPGSFADESARLLAALQEWAAKGRAAARDLADGLESSAGGMGHSPECTVCPICQAVRLLRNTRPEVIEHFSDAATSFLSALSGLVAGDAEGAMPGGGGRSRPERAQHIDVTGDDGADETSGATG